MRRENQSKKVLIPRSVSQPLIITDWCYLNDLEVGNVNSQHEQESRTENSIIGIEIENIQEQYADRKSGDSRDIEVVAVYTDERNVLSGTEKYVDFDVLNIEEETTRPMKKTRLINEGNE